MNPIISLLWYGLWGLGVLSLVATTGRDHRTGRGGLRRTVKSLLAWTAAYILVVEGTVAVFMVACAAAGYVPYGDRPGPGWHMAPHLPSLKEVGSLTGWAVFGAIIFLNSALPLAAIARACQAFRFRRLVRVAGLGVLYGFFGGLTIGGVGWYIAMAGPAVDVGALASLGFGCTFGWRMRVEETR